MQGAIQINDRLTVARLAPDRAELQQAAQDGFLSMANVREADEKQELELNACQRCAGRAGRGSSLAACPTAPG